MRLPGYCTGCRRPRQVKVTGHALAMAAAGNVVEGICSECEQKEDERRRTRRGGVPRRG